MEAHLNLQRKTDLIGSATDFTYKWCINIGMNAENSAALSLTVDELLTYITQYANENQGGNIEIWYTYQISEIEIVIKDQDGKNNTLLHSYGYIKNKADQNDDLKEMKIKIARKLTDKLIFLNKGKDGKEFRVVKELKTTHIESIMRRKNLSESFNVMPDSKQDYILTPATPEDAEDISKLIYRTYDYSYFKDDLYFPTRVEMALKNDLKFGVIARTANNKPAGYFAVIKKENSLIGEVGEAVVSPDHRKRGLMKKMLFNLIHTSRDNGLIGLYGTAVAVHLISQKVNRKFGFISTAIILGEVPAYVFRHMDNTLKNPLSVILDYLPLTDARDDKVFLPDCYREKLVGLYSQFKKPPEILKLPGKINRGQRKTDLHLKLKYDSNTALVIVKKYGNTFKESVDGLLLSLRYLKLNSIYIDLPLNDPWIDPATEYLKKKHFILAGIMPMFHNETDHLRMQKINTEINFTKVRVLVDEAIKLKETLKKEYYDIQAI